MKQAWAIRRCQVKDEGKVGVIQKWRMNDNSVSKTNKIKCSTYPDQTEYRFSVNTPNIFQVFLKANIDVSELTNTIISQNYVGSIVKVTYFNLGLVVQN